VERLIVDPFWDSAARAAVGIPDREVGEPHPQVRDPLRHSTYQVLTYLPLASAALVREPVALDHE
jgi:hypothetical protein